LEGDSWASLLELGRADYRISDLNLEFFFTIYETKART
jgi:hypothetical protein